LSDKEPVFDQHYFEQSYRSYELQNPPRKLAFYRRLVEGALTGRSAPRVLEVGCAFGRFLAQLDPSWERFGVDVNEFTVERAQRAAPGACVDVGSATEIPFEGSFDAILAFDVLEHVRELDCARVALCDRLATGGHLIFVVPVYDGVTGPLIHLLDRDPTHVHKRSRWFWLAWAEANLRLVEWWGLYRYLLPGGHYLHWPTRALRRFTPAIAIVARRSSEELSNDRIGGDSGDRSVQLEAN
jgi:SAM-dependent methyltransferase